jgi:hypothetical protein
MLIGVRYTAWQLDGRAARDIRLIDLLPDVLDVDQGRDGADLGVLRAL